MTFTSTPLGLSIWSSSVSHSKRHKHWRIAGLDVTPGANLMKAWARDYRGEVVLFSQQKLQSYVIDAVRLRLHICSILLFQ